MDFGGALKALHAGECVARDGWSGKGMFVFRVPHTTITVSKLPLLDIFPAGTQLYYLAHTIMRTAQGDLVPWLASQTDIEAGDWEVVAKPSAGATPTSSVSAAAIDAVVGATGATGPVGTVGLKVASPTPTAAEAAAAATTSAAPQAKPVRTAWLIRKKPVPNIFTPAWWNGVSFVEDPETAKPYNSVSEAQADASKIGQPVEIAHHAFKS